MEIAEFASDRATGFFVWTGDMPEPVGARTLVSMTNEDTFAKKILG